MDPNQIAAMLASGDREQVKSAQKQLQALGYDIGPGGADGGLGKNTSLAMAQYKADFEKKQAADQAAQDRANAVELAKANRDTARENARAAENDPTNRLVKMGTEVAPYVAGAGIGTAIGHGFGTAFKEGDAAMRGDIGRLASARNIASSVKEGQMNALLRGRTGRNIAQFGVPAMLYGGGVATRDLIAPQFSDPTTRDIINSVGTGENAAALTTAVHQGVNVLRNLGKGADPLDVARIRSENLPPAPPAPAAPPSSPPAALPPAGPEEPMRHADRLKLAATASGAKPGTSKGANVAAIRKNLTAENMADVAQSLRLPADATRPQILQRLRELGRTGGKLVLPLAAAGIAYDMASGGQAEAANGMPASEPSMGNKLGAAAVAGGTAYGANKLLEMMPAGGGAIVGGAVAPSVISDMTDQFAAPEARNWAARNFPSWARGGAVENAYQMAQVPEPSPVRDQSAPPAQQPQDFDAQVADLERIFAQLHAQGSPASPQPVPQAVPPAQTNPLLAPY